MNTFIDLFAGIVCLRQGFESTGDSCIWTSEWNKFSVKTYAENYGDHEIHGDITAIDAKDIPSHDILIGGFPCQAFSLAGLKKGFEDTRGTLFFDVARIIEYHKPKAFLLENVKNLKSHDKGNTFKTIERTLSDMGYSVQHRVISSKHFVPQNRERIYIVGFKGTTDFDINKIELPSEAPTLSAILHPENGTEAPTPYTDANGKVLPKYTCSDKLWAYLQAHAAKHKAAGNGFGFGMNTPDTVARTLSARYYKDGSEILLSQAGKNPRRLTPRECARLMGFSDELKIPVSDVQAYKQFGNSVVVPVIKLIAKNMHQHIN